MKQARFCKCPQVTEGLNNFVQDLTFIKVMQYLRMLRYLLEMLHIFK